MAFLTNIKRLFGFGNETEDEIYADDITADDAPATDTDTPDQAQPTQTQRISPDAMRQIFTRVVEIINTSLPQFISQAVDPEKQKQYIFDSLDQSVKDYIASLDNAAMQKNAAIWQAEREKIKSDMEALKTRAKELEDKRNEIKEKQLSADRQRRALSERVHDLEAQVLRLEAETEQLRLENTSLLNKMKVAAVYQQELEELRKKTDAPTPDVDVEQLQKEIHDLREAIKAAKIKSEMEDKMLSDIRNQSAQKDVIIAEKDQTIAQINERLADAPSDEELEQIRTTLEKFAEVKDKLDARIARLSASLKDAQTENRTLRDTIKANLLQHAEEQRQLREQLDALKAQVPQAETKKEKTAETRRRNRRSPAETLDIDEVRDIISDTDWLVSVPPPGRSMRPDPDQDTSFGYQAPTPKKRPLPNDPQPNLFDL